MSEPEFLTKDAAAQMLGLSVRRTMELAEQGTLKGYRRFNAVTRRQAVMFPAAEIVKYLEDEAKRKAQMSAVPWPAGNLPGQTLRSPGDISPSAPAWLHPRPWLTLDEAAEYSGLSRRLLARLIREGCLPALKEPTRRNRYRVRRADLDRLEGVSQ